MQKDLSVPSSAHHESLSLYIRNARARACAREGESEIRSPDFKIRTPDLPPIRAENGAKEILACFLKKTGQVLKKISSVSKETGGFRWDRKDLPMGPESGSGGIGKAFRWDRKGAEIQKIASDFLYLYPSCK